MAENSPKKVNIIVAVANANAIGRNGDLVYHLRADLRRFKEITWGHTVIMGRKTWESLPKGALPGRRNIVITRNVDFEAEGAEVVHSLSEALDCLNNEEKGFIIGGAEIYRQALSVAEQLYLTRIFADAPGADTFFPDINADDWVITGSTECFVDAETSTEFQFVCLTRK